MIPSWFLAVLLWYSILVSPSPPSHFLHLLLLWTVRPARWVLESHTSKLSKFTASCGSKWIPIFPRSLLTISFSEFSWFPFWVRLDWGHTYWSAMMAFPAVWWDSGRHITGLYFWSWSKSRYCRTKGDKSPSFWPQLSSWSPGTSSLPDESL